MIHELDTMPMPVVWNNRALLPTLRQLRARCRLTHTQIARAANVRPCVVFWMEQGVAVFSDEALSVLSVLSFWCGQYYSLTSVRGIRLKSVLRGSRPEFGEVI